MTPHDAFLQAIIESPDDDGPRLMYADWLDEQGDPDRAELIRVGCQLGRLLGERRNRHALEYRARQLLCVSDGVFRYEGNLAAELETRECELIAAKGKQWAEPLTGLVDYYGFRRGFIEEVGMTGRAFMTRAEDLFRLAPVRHVSFAQVPPVLLPTLLESPFLARLHSISLAHRRIGPKGAEALARCPHLAGLRELNLMHCRVGDEGLQALLASPQLMGLKAIDVWNNDLTEQSVKLLANRRLDHLSIGCNALGKEGEQTLRERLGHKVTFGLYGAPP